MTVTESEDDKAFWEIFDEFKNFVTDKTNCTVMQHKRLEADDLIAGWVQAHPNDHCVIISTDGDFAQLVGPNCTQYNGVANVTITDKGYFNDDGTPVIEKKTQEIKPAPQPDFMLFEKCMRGDTSDNVFSAYPGVRKKGTKNKVGLIEAYEDKGTKGYNWNNMMLQRWTDHEGVEHRVLDDYNRNVVLCDLTAQPADVREIINTTIAEHAKPKEIQQVGMRLMKFCAKWDMQRIADQAQTYAAPLQARYPV
jgi:5'-3' exonuclease